MAKRRAPSGATPAITSLLRGGTPHVVHAYEADPERVSATSYGEAVAVALDVDPRRVFKTLVVSVDGALAVGVVPVAATLDLKAFAAAIGGKRAVMATPADAERATGYVVGGISPLGQRAPLPTVIDETAFGWPTVLVSAGRRGLQVELDPAALAAATGAQTALIATG